MLDLEGFDDGYGGATSRGGSTSKAGSSGGTSPKGGASSRGGTSSAGAPVGIAGKTSMVPGTSATEPCRQYCRGYSVTCAQELEDDNCQALCEDELNAASPPCEALGIEAVKCLTPFFQAGNGSCEAATNRGLVQCGATLAKFKTCSGAGPTPGPGPGPGPAVNEPASCANMGAVSPYGCQVTFACSSGLYDISCEANPDMGGGMHCYCYRDNQGTMFGIGQTSSSSACYDAFKYCP